MNVVIAVTQMACSDNADNNLDQAESLVREAATQGADVVLVQELFSGPYFCKDQSPKFFDLAHETGAAPEVALMRDLARELGVVLPVSFFERAGQAYFNSLAMVDADGSVLGVYRKTHIPDGPGYQEKFYFNPGDTGFKVWKTRCGNIGVGVCWDQWFPECARSMALMGADMLLYPTAIGSEPSAPYWDSSGHWTRVMQGHAAANIMPVAASNRIGTERGETCDITFYGSSFIAGPTGEVVAQAGRSERAVLTASFDLEAIRSMRANWGLFRDRRPSQYRALCGLDGSGAP